MTDDELLPTFATNRDRLTYLAAEYKIPLSIVSMGVGVWALFFVPSPSIPSPPDWMLSASLSASMLAFPAFFLAKRVVKWLYDPGEVLVGVIDGGRVPDDPDEAVDSAVVAETYAVPETTWSGRREIGYPAVEPDEGNVDAVVTRFDWHAEIEELVVRGAERSVLPPDEVLRSAKRVNEVYDEHHKLQRQFSELKAEVERYATEAHDAAIMALLAEQEDAELVEGAGVTGELSDEEIAEELPERPGPDATVDGDASTPTVAPDGGEINE